jgi:plasmid maintenance system antidote protein VapI
MLLPRRGDVSERDRAVDLGLAQSSVSAVLIGARSLIKGQILKLAKFFDIALAAFKE